jgi:serine protease inhibitor
MKNRLMNMALLLVLSALVASGCAPATGTTSPLPTPTTGGQPSGPLDPAGARDAGLAYLAQNYAGQAPAAGLTWTEKNTTPQGLVGAESYEYSTGDWIITVAYPVVAPESVVYTIVVANQATGFHWEGKVDAAGQVTETASQETPAAGEGQADVPALVSGNTAFALDLYQALKGQPGNLFFSPYSISQALAMTYAGARGETEQQMAKVLRFNLPQAGLHLSFKSLGQELAQRGEGAQGQDAKGFRLNVVNALWGQQGYQFLPAFLDLLSQNYGAGMQFVDYVNAAEQARTTINDWVSQQTEGKIKDLIPAGVLDSLTRLVLTNAIYFNAAWATPFDKGATQEGAFTLLDGSQVQVPMMKQTESLGYAEGEGYQAVELPYDGRELSMIVLLPAKSQFKAFEGSLDAAQVEAILRELAPGQIALTMPRFKFDSEFSLKDRLSQMGMPLAFTSDADFSGMTGNRELSISAVLHKAFVSVDEAGTEAAAATAVVVGLTSAPASPVEVTIDRPFLFLIRDVKTGAVLFLGRVVDPSQ